MMQVLRELEADPRWPDWQEGRMTPRDWHAHLSEKFHLSLRLRGILRDLEQRARPETILPDLLFERLAQNVPPGPAFEHRPHPRGAYRGHVSVRPPFPRARLFLPRRIEQARSRDLSPRAAEVDALPEEAMFIDDVRENVMAAASLGINAFHFTSADELLAEFSRLGLWNA